MPADPEAVYGRLASGDSGRVREVAGEIYAAAALVDDAADDIAHGTRVPWWSGPAGSAYRHAGQHTYVAAAATSWHVCRAADFVAAAADRYDQLREDALHVVTFWRQRDPALTMEQVDQLRALVLLNLAFVAIGYSSWLRDAGTALHRDGGESFEAWLVTGLQKEYDLLATTGAVSGPRIPDSLLGGEDYVPQGLAYDPDAGSAGQSYHTSYRKGADGGPDDSRLTVVDHATGREVTSVELLGQDGADPPNHSGGVAYVDGLVYVVGGGKLYTYTSAAIEAAGPGGAVAPIAVDDVPASSYVTSHGGRLYLGLWADPGEEGDGYQGEDKGALYEYDPSTHQVTETYYAPEGVNGAVFQDGTVTYAVNNGRYDESTLVTYEHAGGATGDKVNELTVGNLVEEIELGADGSILVTSEAGALPYSPFDDDGGTDTSWDRLDELWAQSRITAVPGGVVTGAYDVDPPTLGEAARTFDAASDDLDAAATRISGLSLPPWTLGEVSGAAAFAGKVDLYLEQAADNIEAGRGTTGGMAGGLVDQMRTYEDTDDGVATGWDRLGGLALLQTRLSSTPEAPPVS